MSVITFGLGSAPATGGWGWWEAIELPLGLRPDIGLETGLLRPSIGMQVIEGQPWAMLGPVPTMRADGLEPSVGAAEMRSGGITADGAERPALSLSGTSPSVKLSMLRASTGTSTIRPSQDTEQGPRPDSDSEEVD